MFRNIARLFYTGIFSLALPFLFLRLWLRSFKLPAYRRRWHERLGLFQSPPSTGGLWIHAVSLGEVNAASLIIKAFKKSFPQIPITITTMTVTGSQRVKDLFADQVFHVYVPYDVPVFISLFLRKIKPRLAVIMETELWPNLLHMTYSYQIPLILANARLSERSAKNYTKIKFLVEPMLKKFAFIATQSELEKQRFIQLGANPSDIETIGNIKFDLEIPADVAIQAEQLKQALGQKIIWVAGSTHEGEEEILLEIYQKLQIHHPQLLLFLIPRHPERFESVYQLCIEKHLSPCRRTELNSNQSNFNVLIGNTTGELLTFYQLADFVFVGGSLVPIGGHNFLEAALLKKAIIVGNQLFNFTEIANLFRKNQAFIEVTTAEELQSTIEKLLQHPEQKNDLAQKAYDVAIKNRGALNRLLVKLSVYFSG